MTEIQRLGRIELEREMHCFDAGGGDIVESRPDGGEQICAPHCIEWCSSLGNEDGFIGDGDFECFGVCGFIEL